MTKNVQDDANNMNLKVEKIFFQQVQDFKYLEVNITNKNCMHNKIGLF